MKVTSIALAVLMGACGGDALAFRDGGSLDDGGPITGGVLLATKSPPGPTNGNPTTWDGVLAYRIERDGAAPIALAGIAATTVYDPVDVLFHASASEILVAN